MDHELEGPRFPSPGSAEEVIPLLNASHAWNLSLVERHGRIYLLDGDQPVFVARTLPEAEAFLAACFLVTYRGGSLERIKEEIASGRFDDIYGDDALDSFYRRFCDWRFLER